MAKQLCGARCRPGKKCLAIAESQGRLPEVLKRTYCKRPVTPGRNRCHLHGGASTGAVTHEGWLIQRNNLSLGALYRWGIAPAIADLAMYDRGNY